ncbi:precorrin-2 dehydrogenase/sirohydrochlorin ferrochelatase family protein [Thermoactinomyces mirandus]|uniref:precorrin-2 dehydrogenase n=1 Tax=Thermoactinomyces mirandus TaxID=2756294 RepID=A0A7W1XSY5_9BACL|nr:bifunctional precorrin-2 dehydrogenase/sirohydrochlorin ferrochelatase [Thermoactinomyces mirandus]MBA4602697.1 bifunctional precorrin-2 dehydrogenase/sirohydrochlorin ferrochelatase [Thermoactinomyces mirandus]
MTQRYAMMVNLKGRPCLVVGGGKVAERKAGSLIGSGACVKLVSPSATPRIKKWALSGKIEWINRVYRKEDNDNQFLIIAATNDKNVNRQVHQAAILRNQWINVVDQPELCNFMVPSTVRRGNLQIHISTNGACPAVAQKIRQDLEEIYGTEYELYLDLMQEMRKIMRKKVADVCLRRQLLKELLSEQWVDLCRKESAEAREKMLNWLEKMVTDSDKKGGSVACGRWS